MDFNKAGLIESGSFLSLKLGATAVPVYKDNIADLSIAGLAGGGLAYNWQVVAVTANGNTLVGGINKPTYYANIQLDIIAMGLDTSRYAAGGWTTTPLDDDDNIYMGMMTASVGISQTVMNIFDAQFAPSIPGVGDIYMTIGNLRVAQIQQPRMLGNQKFLLRIIVRWDFRLI